MNGYQLRNRWRRNAFMRETLEREIIRVRQEEDPRPGHLNELQSSLRKYTGPFGRNMRSADSDNRTFWGLVARLKIKQAVQLVSKKRRNARRQRRQQQK